MKNAAIMKYLRQSSRLLISEVKGALWFSDAYIAAPLSVDMHLLLADYNLSAEPMVCEVGSTIRRQADREAVDIEKLVVPCLEKATAPLSPLLIGGRQVLTSGERGETLEYWTLDGTTPSHTFNAAKSAFLDGLHGSVTMKADPDRESGPVLRVDDDGEPAGLIMPVRILAVEAAWSKKAAA